MLTTTLEILNDMKWKMSFESTGLALIRTDQSQVKILYESVPNDSTSHEMKKYFYLN